jgi:hypothetical protein
LLTGSCVWFHLLGFQLDVVWQLMQLVEATGMWVADLPVALAPLWQLVQFVEALNVLWSTLAVFQLLVLLWQLSQTVWPAWMAVLGLLAAWQLAQPSLTATLACSLAGAQAVKPALWQLSHPSEASVETFV